MKTANLIPFLFLFLTGSPIFSQLGNVNGRRSNANFEANLAANNIMRGRDIFQDVLKRGKNNNLKLEEIEGEPYFESIFTNGALHFKDSLDLGQFLIRYNAFTDEMEVSNPSGIKILNKVDGLSVTLQNDKYVVLSYAGDDDTIKKGFFIEKTKGSEASLYLRKYITLKPPKEAKTSFHTATPPSFTKHSDYFLKFENNAPLKVNLKKRKILNSFPEKTNILKKYISSLDLSLDAEKDFIILVDYYNELLN